MNEQRSKAYAKQIDTMARQVEGWRAAHPGKRAVFCVPPREAMVIMPLSEAVKKCCGNNEARELAAELMMNADVEPTLFMLRVALAESGHADVLTVPLAVFLEGYDFAGFL